MVGFELEMSMDSSNLHETLSFRFVFRPVGPDGNPTAPALLTPGGTNIDVRSIQVFTRIGHVFHFFKFFVFLNFFDHVQLSCHANFPKSTNNELSFRNAPLTQLNGIIFPNLNFFFLCWVL